jgi:hypothetical protein
VITLQLLIRLNKNKVMIRKVFLKLIIAQALILGSCSSDETEEKIIETPEGQVETYTVTNLLSNSGSDSYTDIADPIYYNLDENKVVDKALVQTSQWDIELSGAFNTSIKANNKLDKKSSGYQGAGTSQIFLYKSAKIEADYFDPIEMMPKRAPERSLFDKALEELTEIPAEKEMTAMSEIGLNLFMGGQEGWCFYDMGGGLFPNAGRDKEHVIYALPRIIVIKTNKGNYVKLSIQSIYKNNPEDPNRSHKPGHISFKYTIQKNGTKKFTK